MLVRSTLAVVLAALCVLAQGADIVPSWIPRNFAGRLSYTDADAVTGAKVSFRGTEPAAPWESTDVTPAPDAPNTITVGVPASLADCADCEGFYSAEVYDAADALLAVSTLDVAEPVTVTGVAPLLIAPAGSSTRVTVTFAGGARPSKAFQLELRGPGIPVALLCTGRADVGADGVACDLACAQCEPGQQYTLVGVDGTPHAAPGAVVFTATTAIEVGAPTLEGVLPPTLHAAQAAVAGGYIRAEYSLALDGALLDFTLAPAGGGAGAGAEAVLSEGSYVVLRLPALAPGIYTLTATAKEGGAVVATSPAAFEVYGSVDDAARPLAVPSPYAWFTDDAVSPVLVLVQEADADAVASASIEGSPEAAVTITRTVPAAGTAVEIRLTVPKCTDDCGDPFVLRILAASGAVIARIGAMQLPAPVATGVTPDELNAKAGQTLVAVAGTFTALAPLTLAISDSKASYDRGVRPRDPTANVVARVDCSGCSNGAKTVSVFDPYLCTAPAGLVETAVTVTVVNGSGGGGDDKGGKGGLPDAAIAAIVVLAVVVVLGVAGALVRRRMRRGGSQQPALGDGQFHSPYEAL